MPFFSVIIPTYNRAALIGEALDSVFAQEFQDYEVIVVDDGSTDGTPEVLQRYGDRIRLVRQENKGPGAARNTGIRQAQGEYVAFLDSDDVWFPWTLASYRQLIEACRRPSFVCGDCLAFTRADEIAAVSHVALAYEPFEDYYAALWLQNIWIGVCAAVVKTYLLRDVGGFMEGHVNAEDSDLWMQLGTAPGFVHVKSPLLFGYRSNPGGAAAMGERTFQGLRQMILKEQAGRYPGGSVRRRERLRILTRHVRPASIGCLQRGDIQGARWLYRNTVRWHLRLGRFRYLVALPLLCALRSCEQPTQAIKTPKA